MEPPTAPNPELPRPQRMFWRRVAAVVVDILVLAVVGMTLSAAFFEPFVRMGSWARVIGATIALAYAVSLDARGGTLGKKLVRLRVAGPGGTAPGVGRALLRNVVRVLPWFFVNAWMPWPGFLRAFGASLPFALYAGSALGIAFGKSHRALHDVVAGTQVERLDSPHLTVEEPAWRLGALYAVPVIIAAVSSVPALRPAKLEPLERVMEAVLALPSHPLVEVNDNTFYGPGEKKIRTLNVAASFDGPESDSPQFAKQIASRVRDSGVDLSPYELLHVTARRLAVTGIGYVVRNYSESFPIAAGTASGQPVRNFEKLAPEGPVNWSVNGASYEATSWFVRSKDKDGSPGLFYVVEWNCPPCDPKKVTKERAQELAAPVLRYICDSGAWKRFSLDTGAAPVRAGWIGVQIVDRSVGAVYPRYGVVKSTAEACGNSPAR